MISCCSTSVGPKEVVECVRIKVVLKGVPTCVQCSYMRVERMRTSGEMSVLSEESPHMFTTESVLVLGMKADMCRCEVVRIVIWAGNSNLCRKKVSHPIYALSRGLQRLQMLLMVADCSMPFNMRSTVNSCVCFQLNPENFDDFGCLSSKVHGHLITRASILTQTYSSRMLLKIPLMLINAFSFQRSMTPPAYASAPQVKRTEVDAKSLIGFFERIVVYSWYWTTVNTHISLIGSDLQLDADWILGPNRMRDCYNHHSSVSYLGDLPPHPRIFEWERSFITHRRKHHY